MSNVCKQHQQSRFEWIDAREIFNSGSTLATNGVFDKDPEVYSDAKFYKTLTYNEVLEKNLKVMDMTAISLCRDGKLPVMVFNINKSDNIVKIVMGDNLGTTIKE